MIDKSHVVTLGHSPDPDDAFMFYALKEDKIDAQGWKFEHILQDIQTLNERATRGELDVSAISFHAYTHVADKYAMMPCGASMGDNYGPMLVQKAGKGLPANGVDAQRNHLKGKTVAVPGLMTSAFLAFQLFWGGSLAVPGNSAEQPKILVVPFDQIFDAVNQGDADVGLIIHEGQLTYRDMGFDLIVDLGQWFHTLTGGLPLPLGGNVIHKRFTPEQRVEITAVLKESIAYSLKHREPAVVHSMQYGRGLDQSLADRFVGMYVNDLTLDYGERGRAGIRKFFDMAYELKVLPRRVEVEFV